MATGDLHSALKTEELGKEQGGGVQFVLMRLQDSKTEIRHTVHANPTTWSSGGLQTSDVLALLGFSRTRCPFHRSEAYCREIHGEVHLKALAEAFGACYDALREAERRLSDCGIFLRAGGRRGYGAPSGNGHTAPKSERMKESEDANFRYVFSWMEGGRDKGWTTHHRPKHPPASPEVQGVLDFLGFQSFRECPQFDFEECFWRFTPFEQRGDSLFDANADVAHRWFDAHAANFSIGLERLLAAHAAVEPFGLRLLPRLARSKERKETSIRSRVIEPEKGRTLAASADEYEFDVAVSFAGTEREYAEKLSTHVRDAGLRVFYDDFYPEALWGKDLVEFFDEIYRKRSRYCVIFVSSEYVQRMWTTHERRSAQARALQERAGEYILPIKVEDIELPGMPNTVGYLSLNGRSIEEIASILLKKLAAAQTRATRSMLSRSSFRTRPIPGEGSTLLNEPETYAQLAIANAGQALLKKCSVRLLSIDHVVNGHLVPQQPLQPRLMRWSSREQAAYGRHRQWLDIPNDREERILDVAVLDRSDLGHWRVVSADPADRPAYGRGWYRVVVAIASESDTPNKKRVKLRLGLGSRTDPPPPLILSEWHDGDEKRLQDD